MNHNSYDTAKAIPQHVTLSRDLGLFTITMIGVGGMIGAGIFVLTAIVPMFAAISYVGWICRRRR